MIAKEGDLQRLLRRGSQEDDIQSEGWMTRRNQRFLEKRNSKCKGPGQNEYSRISKEARMLWTWKGARSDSSTRYGLGFDMEVSQDPSCGKLDKQLPVLIKLRKIKYCNKCYINNSPINSNHIIIAPYSWTNSPHHVSFGWCFVKTWFSLSVVDYILYYLSTEN